MRIAVIGAGAWGTAMAAHAAKRHDVHLYARSPQHAQQLIQAQENVRYLPGIRLPQTLKIGVDWTRAHADLPFELLVLATPIAGLYAHLLTIRALEDAGIAQAVAPLCPMVWLCKGLTPDGLLPHELAGQVLMSTKTGALTGPSFALEVAHGLPTALVAASGDTDVQALMVKAFHFEHLRVYGNDDVVGAQVGGAVKNILAIAVGLCDGLALGLNARAALMTRGLAEMTRFGVKLGARADTFMGLTGLGDLILTATGDLSRNRKVGLALAQGLSLDAAVQSLGHVAEGVACTRAVHERAMRLAVDMPITACVNELLAGDITPQEAVHRLLSRDAKSEVLSQTQ